MGFPRPSNFLSGKAQVYFGIFHVRLYGWGYCVLKGERINRMNMNGAMSLGFRARKQALSHTICSFDKDILSVVKKI